MIETKTMKDWNKNHLKGERYVNLMSYSVLKSKTNWVVVVNDTKTIFKLAYIGILLLPYTHVVTSKWVSSKKTALRKTVS